jgi:hypothetical protein
VIFGQNCAVRSAVLPSCPVTQAHYLLLTTNFFKNCLSRFRTCPILLAPPRFYNCTYGLREWTTFPSFTTQLPVH